MWFLIKSETLTEIVQSDNRPEITSDGTRYSMCSGGYDTKEELIKKMEVLKKSCTCCGSIVYTTFGQPVKRIMIEKNICFECYLWQDRIEHRTDRNIVVGGVWYSIGEDNEDGPFRGHGGREFKFKRGDEIITSKNVWYGGKVPEHFRKRIPDNAVML